MAYVKMKPFHTNKGKTIAETLKKRTEYAQNPDKTSLKNIIEYAENHDKTENGEFVLTYECDTQTADTDFLAAKKEYHRNTGRKQKSDVLGYSIIQSFKPGEVTPQRAAAIGYELAMRWTKGNHAFVVGTHLDKSHLHCHVVFNSVNLDCSKKFRNFWGSVGAIRRLSNIISIENGLSIIKPSRNKTKNFDKWTSGVKMPTDRQQLEKIIDEVFTENPKSFNEFITLLENKNCEFKRSRNSVRLPKKKGFLRLDSLTDGYKQDDIQRKIEGDFKGETMSFQPNISRENNSQDFNLIIDLENSIKAQNSPGYEHWTKIFNLKQAAKTLVFLQENDLDEMEKLDVAAQKSKDDYNEIVTKIQAADLRLGEISELQKHIGAYIKTKDIYAEFKRRKFSKKFYAENKNSIETCKAAKRFFDENNLEKLPTINLLRQEYATILAEKKRLYSSQTTARNYMQKMLAARQNANMILSYRDGEKYVKVERNSR